MKNPRFFALWLLLIGTIEAASSSNHEEALEGLTKDKLKEVLENLKIYETANDERVPMTMDVDDPILGRFGRLDSDASRARRHLFPDPERRWDKGARLLEAADEARAQMEREDAQTLREQAIRQLRAVTRAREGRERERQRNERGRQVW